MEEILLLFSKFNHIKDKPTEIKNKKIITTTNNHPEKQSLILVKLNTDRKIYIIKIN